MTTDEIVGKVLQEYRWDKRLSNGDMAKKAQVSASNLSSIFSGKRGMPITTFVRICDNLHIDIAEFMQKVKDIRDAERKETSPTG